MQDQSIQLALGIKEFQGVISKGTEKVSFSHSLNKHQPKLKDREETNVPDHVETDTSPNFLGFFSGWPASCLIFHTQFFSSIDKCFYFRKFGHYPYVANMCSPVSSLRTLWRRSPLANMNKNSSNLKMSWRMTSGVENKWTDNTQFGPPDVSLCTVINLCGPQRLHKINEFKISMHFP